MFSFLRKKDSAAEAAACHQRGMDLLKENKAAQSLTELQRAVQLAPTNAVYLNGLATSQRTNGDAAGAEMNYRKSLEIDETYTAPLYNLALLLLDSNKFDEAERRFRQLQTRQLDDADVLFHLGHLLASRSAFGEAVQMYERALQLTPDNAHLWLSLGQANRALPDRLEEAIQCLRKSVSLQPGFIDAHVTLGALLKQSARLDEAAKAYRTAIEIDPNQPQLHMYLAETLYAMGQWSDAISEMQETVRLDPANSAAYSNIGAAMIHTGQTQESIDYFKRAIAAQPDAVDPHIQLGTAYSSFFGRHDLAQESFETAVRLDPGNIMAKRCLLGEMQHTCNWMNLDSLVEEYRQHLRAHPEFPADPYDLLSIPSTASEQLHHTRSHAKRTSSKANPVGAGALFTHDRQQCQRLKIGYLSNDFRNHALAYLLPELIELHDRTRFEIAAYSFGVDDGSAARERFVHAFDTFEDIRAFSFINAARKIHDDKVDILVDLMGYTQGARTEILCLRPAPVQVNYLGYPGTMGADFMDYIIADRIITPPEHEGFYAEKVVTLPGSYQANDRKRPFGPIKDRAALGLPESAFVYCCFNRNHKISSGMFAAWMQILHGAPAGVLWLLQGNSWSADNLRREAARHGSSEHRLIFAPPLPIDQHLSRLRNADLFLDTSPYGAHTTASDALWMGLPVITCIGETFASRVAASLLHATGIPEMVTHTMDEYVALASRLALNADELGKIRHKLGQSRTTAPLFDTPAYARNLETAYQKMWANHMAGAGPQPIYL